MMSLCTWLYCSESIAYSAEDDEVRYRGCVNDWSHLYKVVQEYAVEEGLIPVLQPA